MSDEEKKAKADDTEGQATPAAAETSEQESERTFSQKELDKIVKRESAKAVRKAARTAPAAPEADKGTPAATAVAPSSEPNAELAARIERMEQQNSWNRVALEKQLKPAQSDALFDLYLAQSPDDAGAWIDDTLEAMGVARKEDKPGTQAPPPSNGSGTSGAPAHVQPQKPTVPFDPGAASGAPREASLDPRQWNSEDIQRLRSITEANGRSKFMNDVDKWVDTLDGGQPLFRKGIPKG